MEYRFNLGTLKPGESAAIPITPELQQAAAEGRLTIKWLGITETAPGLFLKRAWILVDGEPVGEIHLSWEGSPDALGVAVQPMVE